MLGDILFLLNMAGNGLEKLYQKGCGETLKVIETTKGSVQD